MLSGSAPLYSPDIVEEMSKVDCARRWQHKLRCMSAYPADLTDAEWLCLDSLLATPKTGSRTRIHSLRAVLDDIFLGQAVAPLSEYTAGVA